MLLFELFEAEKPSFFHRMDKFDVSPMDVGILKELGDREPVPMGDLAVCRNHDRSSVTRFVDRLVQKGWVERRELPSDRRVKTLSLTAEGRSVRERILAALSVAPESVAELPKADQERLVAILEKAIDNAKARIATEVEDRKVRA